MRGDIFFLDDAGRLERVDAVACVATGFRPQWSQALLDGDLVADSLLDAAAGSRLVPVSVIVPPSRIAAVITRMRTRAPLAMSPWLLVLRLATARR